MSDDEHATSGNGRTLAVHEYKLDELQKTVNRLETKLDLTLTSVLDRMNQRQVMCTQHTERLAGIAEWQGRMMAVLLMVIVPIVTALLVHLIGGGM